MSQPNEAEGPEPTGPASHRVEPAYAEPEWDEVSLVQLVNVVLRHRWKILGAPLVVAFLVAGYTLLQPTSWTSRVSFIPETGEGAGPASGLSNLASRLGVGLPGVGGPQLPQFYADLLTSRRILDAAVQSPYDFGEGRDRVPVEAPDGTADARSLLEHWEVEGETESDRIAAAASSLRGALQVSTDLETGLVSVAVSTGDPVLSKQIVERLVELVNQFNTRTRQSQAAAEASFVQERLRQTRQELRAAEDTLESFLERNRRFENLPELRFEHDRLQRQVQLKQSIHNSLAQSYEQARIDQVRSTPVITVVETPVLPTRPDSARMGLKVALGLVLGGMLGLFWAFGAEYVGKVPEEEPEEYETFAALRREAGRDLKRLAGGLRRLGRGDGEG